MKDSPNRQTCTPMFAENSSPAPGVTKFPNPNLQSSSQSRGHEVWKLYFCTYDFIFHKTALQWQLVSLVCATARTHRGRRRPVAVWPPKAFVHTTLYFIFLVFCRDTGHHRHQDFGCFLGSWDSIFLQTCVPVHVSILFSIFPILPHYTIVVSMSFSINAI